MSQISVFKSGIPMQTQDVTLSILKLSLWFANIFFVVGCGAPECLPLKFDPALKIPQFEMDSSEGMDSSTKLSLMTFNILYESNLEPLLNVTRNKNVPAWSARVFGIMHLLEAYQPDILAVQESSPWQATCLASMLSDYAMVFGENTTDSILMYRKDVFKELNRKFTPLPSPTSIFPNLTSLIPRGMSSAELEHKFSGVHLEANAVHLNNSAVRVQAEYVAKTYKQKTSLAVLLGDFNRATDTRELSGLLQKGFKDSRDMAQYIRQGRNLKASSFVLDHRNIDHIFLRGKATVKSWEIVERNGVKSFLSDHYPVFAEIKVPCDEYCSQVK